MKPIVAETGPRVEVFFWVAFVAAQLMVLAVATRSPLLAAVFAAMIGVMALLSTVIGTRRGTILIGATLLVVMIVLPGDMALQYRIPVGGGGIFIIDVLLALLLTSVIAITLAEGRLHLVSSPVSLPLFLFLLWILVGAGIGYQSGNDLKLVLQDTRSLSYYVIFFFAIGFLADRRDVLFFLRLLAAGMVTAFLIGAYYAVQGRGMAVEFVEPGVSRFPANDGVFLIASVMLVSFFAVWPRGLAKPKWMWALLFMALLALLLSLVRGNWVAFVVSVVYLLVVLRTHERIRLVGGVLLLVVVLGAGLAVVRPALLRSVVTRASAVTAVQDVNVQYRLIENHATWRQFMDHPIAGNGLGKDYLFDFSRYGVTPYRKSYIHNDYMWFLQRLGLIGMGLYAWVALAFLLPWMKYRDKVARGDPWLLGIMYGGRAVLVALLVVSITSPQLNSKVPVTITALIMGLSEIALTLLRQEAAETSPAAADERAGSASAAVGPQSTGV